MNLILEEGGTEARVFNRTSPVNAPKATIKGVELAAQVPLTFLPGLLDGFGILANGTYIDADEVPTVIGGLAQPLSGLSKYSFNLGGYYEKGPVAVRLSYNYRTRFLFSNGYFNDLGFTRAYGQLDGSINFDLTKQVALSAEFVNITAAKTINDNGDGVLRDILNPGRRISVGARMRF